MNFSIDSGLAYIKGNLQAFFDNSRVLRGRLMSIGKLIQLAKAKGNQTAIGQLIVLQQQTKDLFNEQLALEQQLQPFAQYFGINQTLGMLPVILGLSAVAVASGMYLLIQKSRNQAQALDLVAKGLATPAELAPLLDSSVIGFGGGLGLSLPIVAAIALGLWWFTGGINIRKALGQ